LKKDYKQWAFNGVEVGFSSVPMLFDQWLKRDGLNTVVEVNFFNFFLEFSLFITIDLIHILFRLV